MGGGYRIAYSLEWVTDEISLPGHKCSCSMILGFDWPSHLVDWLYYLLACSLVLTYLELSFNNMRTPPMRSREQVQVPPLLPLIATL